MKRTLRNTILIFILLPLNTLVFSQSQKKITKENINNIIIEAYTVFEKNDNLKLLNEVILYSKNNKIKFRDDFVKGRFIYLEAVFLFTTVANLDEAKEKIYEILSLVSRNKSDKNLKANSLHSLAIILSSLDNKDYFNSIKYLNEAKEIFLELIKNENSKIQLIDITYNLTYLYEKTKNWSMLKTNAKASIKLINKIQQKKGRLKNLYQMIAVSNIESGEYDEAKQNLILAQKLTSKESLRAQKNIDLTYTKNFQKLGKQKQANIKFKEVIKSLDKLKHQRINQIHKIHKRKISLKNKIHQHKTSMLKRQKTFIFLSMLFLILTLLYGIQYIRLNKALKRKLFKIRLLNNKKRETIFKKKSVNLELKRKLVEKQKLLKLNDRILFSKILKISTYNDVINKITNEVSKLIEGTKSIKPNNLLAIEKSLKGLINEDEIWNDIQIQFEKTRPNFFKKLKQLNSDFSVNELKHCSYIISKMQTKDVAKLINVSPRSVETSRYRIKKKLGLDKNTRLYDFLKSLQTI